MISTQITVNSDTPTQYTACSVCKRVRIQQNDRRGTGGGLAFNVYIPDANASPRMYLPGEEFSVESSSHFYPGHPVFAAQLVEPAQPETIFSVLEE